MTINQITKKLQFAGLGLDNLTIRRDEIEVYVEDDRDATEALCSQVQSIFGWVGNRTGYGAWVLRSDAVVNTLDGFSDPMHY